jgi:uncharacterized protein (DUF697 family)
VAQLATRELRQLAYEFAVCVADADGLQNDAEKAFLAGLRAKLGLDEQQAAAFSDKAESVAAAPLDKPTAAEPQFASAMTGADLDKMILNYAILNGALELLPESLATMAIIPLQMKMVYRVGKSHGFELDRGHIKDFIATLGVGLTGQYLEQFGRKLLGGLLGKAGGGLGRTVGRQAASSGLTFATTYAIGRVAQRYYAGGRTLDTATLKQSFTGLLEEARLLAPNYRSQIEQKAGTIDLKSLASLVRQT